LGLIASGDDFITANAVPTAHLHRENPLIALQLPGGFYQLFDQFVEVCGGCPRVHQCDTKNASAVEQRRRNPAHAGSVVRGPEPKIQIVCIRVGFEAEAQDVGLGT
jgi:hypothetical protein